MLPDDRHPDRILSRSPISSLFGGHPANLLLHPDRILRYPDRIPQGVLQNSPVPRQNSTGVLQNSVRRKSIDIKIVDRRPSQRSSIALRGSGHPSKRLDLSNTAESPDSDSSSCTPSLMLMAGGYAPTTTIRAPLPGRGG